MSNLSSVAIRSKCMSIVIGAGEGSRAPRVSEMETSSRSKRTGAAIGAGTGDRAPRAMNIATTSRGKRAGITVGITDGSRIRYAEEASRLQTPRTIKLVGAVEGQGVFDGSDDLTIYITGDYGKLTGKPEINGVVLDGDKTPTELNLQPAGEYADAPIDHSEIDDIINGNAPAPDENNDDGTMSAEDIDHIIG